MLTFEDRSISYKYGRLAQAPLAILGCGSNTIIITHGSISNFINAHKREQSSQSQSSSISKAVELKNNDGPSSSFEGLTDLDISNEQDIAFDTTQTDTLLEGGDYNPALDGSVGEKLLDYAVASKQDTSDVRCAKELAVEQLLVEMRLVEMRLVECKFDIKWHFGFT